jgi:undecaprenyl-diphosphatase
MLSFTRAIIIALIQGVTELFPISSLGHSVLVPAWLHWDSLVNAEHAKESFYLAFVVALHVGSAIALLIYFWRDWVRIIGAFVRTLRTRSVQTADERMAWLLVVATIPTGVLGLVLEHKLRTLFAKPMAAAIFLTINGLILLVAERARRRTRREPSRLDYKEAGVIGLAQTGALFAGISRSGITMGAGLVRGLDHEDAARFSFLLATPIILAAGVYKIPDLLGPLGDGVRSQALVGAIVAGLASYVSVAFLVRYFRSRNLVPFALYCLAAGVISIIRFA